MAQREYRSSLIEDEPPSRGGDDALYRSGGFHGTVKLVPDPTAA
jgi:hypothetical protein